MPRPPASGKSCYVRAGSITDARMFEAILQVLFELFGEVLLQLFLELLAEMGLQAFHGHRAKRRDARRSALNEPVFGAGAAPHPLAAALGYALLGAGAGLLSLFVMPQLMIQGHLARLANLLFTPILAGLMMALIGVWRARRGDNVLRLDKFLYGFLFAFALAAVRFQFAG